MKLQIKKILTEDSELLQSIRTELENSLSSANARGTKIEQLTKTPSPHVSDKPIEKEELEESHHLKDSPIDEHKQYLKMLKKMRARNLSDNPGIMSSAIYESVILTKQRFLSAEPVINKSAANALSKEGLANTDMGSKAVQNSPINSLMNTSDAANGKVLTESSESNFGKVHERSTEGTPLIPNQSTQAAIEEKGKMDRSNNKKIIAGVTVANPSNAINNRKKDGISALLTIQKSRIQ